MTKTLFQVQNSKSLWQKESYLTSCDLVNLLSNNSLDNIVVAKHNY